MPLRNAPLFIVYTSVHYPSPTLCSGYFSDCNNLCPASLCAGGRFANFLPNWETRRRPVAYFFLSSSSRPHCRPRMATRFSVSLVNYIRPLFYSCDHKLLGCSYSFDTKQFCCQNQQWHIIYSQFSNFFFDAMLQDARFC